MGTQGIVSVVRDGKTVLKAIAGMDGSKAHELADEIVQCDLNSAEAVFSAAQRVKFGVTQSLVVQDLTQDLYQGDSELGPLYREKFGDPEFNPRWKYGSADHVVLVDMSDLQCPKITSLCCQEEDSPEA